MRLQFLGADRQVTGSRYLLEAGGLRIMIDCGMFQERKFLERNWQTSPVPPESIDVLLLTHAHLDHCGLLPRLVVHGYGNAIITTRPTVNLAEIIMLDAGRIQEEDAAYKRRRHQKEKRKGAHPEVPLYTANDARLVLPRLQGVDYDKPIALNDQVSVTFRDAGHILGSASLQIAVTESGRTTQVVFSGDVGQWNKPLVHDPSPFHQADYMVMESTYGDRNHRDGGDIADQLADVINDAAGRGGNVVIPTFAMERAQELMYHISRLVHDDRIPDLPVFLDSPMAVDVTDVFRQYRDWLDDDYRQVFEAGEAPFKFPGLKLVRSVDQSKAINHARGSNVIMASAGMCTGGRIKHHLRANITRADSTILFVGYQAEGTLGRQIVSGDKEVRIHGRYWPVRARIGQIFGFSAHGDRDDLLRWLGGLKQPPKHLFLTHGEEHAALALAQTVRDQLKWDVSVPEYQQAVDLG